ncbi:hypothetical protein [Chitinophaga sp. Cy-1792]|uniref:hypothetical protein n=1 Tax=Chitinophaga sp. Cy-1792 TaxID=2608339 RepID=UPI00141E7E5F|nr:hypothetical protein [Chitinophaga sp. Cy-1792]NIG56053.1 hypothetical protein [Chitinophaga sp. Cy-1792]
MKYCLAFLLFAITACNTSNKIYTAPAMGAESKFDDGLRPEKHPQYLFDKKTMKEMKKEGLSSDYTRKRNTAPTAPIKKATSGETLPADSSHMNPSDTLKLPADSSHNISDTANGNTGRQ